MTINDQAFGVCNWFPEHGEHLVFPNDLADFIALRPNGKLFQCVGKEFGYLVLSYGERRFHVGQDVFKAAPAPRYRVGQSVKTSQKQGVVADIEWHFKDSVPIYYVAFSGKRSSRRYLEHELAIDS